MNNTLSKIDVIIPAYKAQDTILRTLSSIAEQEILDDLEVTIVNDADGIGYKEFIDMFSPYMKIKELVMEENGGPGKARAYGIEHTTNPMITFIDADDTFSGRFALKTLRLHMLSNPKVACVFSNFLEDQQQIYLQHPNDVVWMFGKLYKRDFINKYNIKCAPNPRSNEDGYFNTLCRLCSNDNEQIEFIQDITYYWCYKKDSITRKDNGNYSYNQSYVGYTENQIAAIKEAEKLVPFNGEITKHKVMTMCNLYEYLLETKRSDEQYYNQNWECCKLYYKEIFKDIKDKISESILSDCYNNVMRNNYLGNKMYGIIPQIGFKEFLDKLDKETNSSIK
jgi:glycosyltransferase involved in cell wall biosynthesis